MSSLSNLFLGFLFICQFLSYSISAPKSDARGRNLIQLANMIYQTLNTSPFDYNGYGCWCGYGGKGAPIDDTDACCHAHDQCYDEILVTRASLFSCSPYFSFYKWEIDSQTQNPICKNAKNSCAYRICECDRIVIECYKKHVPTFNKTLKCIE